MSSQPTFLRISVVGLGLIGASAAAAWRQAGHLVTGWGPRLVTRDTALARGFVDAAPESLAETVANSDVVVLAAPVLAIRQLLTDIAPHLAAGTVVTDVASTKASVEEWALGVLPANVEWVGGHPMAGRETAGIDHADPTLFNNRVWVVVPSSNASDVSVGRVVRLATDAGSKVITMTAADHDVAVAQVSHVPFMISTALSDAVIGNRRFGEWAPVAATGLRDITRLASGDATMHRDICVTNRDNIAKGLEDVSAVLADLARQVRELPNPASAIGSEELEVLDQTFRRIKYDRDGWLPNAK
ncbi:MAG: prephenate dehydrogenase/arogenate dehydrogenase family protein [Proteobacteria bacterium]|nr:prephenate dehydrogenase/arogenate dehydrogenase family protein [Pseudomonadota bacterium]NBT93902.1 prephenate dehydrogenase/arogenate dehydrogenase family protein [Chloroflexota bacterium]NBT02517.1 prephenate dehydrogenase/arogenate dehydrogenase family protein [Pseudomonadota bacterium]NBT17802.1 prephenate dehydrogenase/arogenate dehydrogenase family protein [Pseudomonadota bacterium]NBY49664.1 prephenate dehydrogenase/arogenate dehydrogenase family protein [Pseudomonadota bacterium]